VELTVQQALQQGVDSHKQGKFQDAERLYRAILQANPNHPDANHNLGVLAVSVGKTKAALPLFKNALEANPRIEQFWLSYIDALIQEQQLGEARKILEQAKKQGVSPNRLNSYEEVLIIKTQLRNSQPTPVSRPVKHVGPSQQQLNNLLVHDQKGEFATAEKNALSITQDYPNHHLAWKVLGAVLWQTGRMSEAVKANQTAVELLPEDAEAQNNLGNMLKELGRLDEAEASCRQAIALRPIFPEAYCNLGNTLKELGRFAEAEASYEQAIALKPDFAEAHNNIGAIQQRLGQLDNAQASYLKAITSKPNFSEAYNNLGNTLQELGRFKEAEARYKQAILLKHNYADAHNNLGVTLQALDRLGEAEGSYAQAIALKPDFFRAHSNLGVLLQELGRFEEAVASYSRAISLKPDFIKARNEMLTCLYLMDKESLFFEQLDYFITQDIPNSVVGSLTSRSNLRYGAAKQNIFCNEPLKHVLLVDLKSRHNFEEVFVRNVKSILGADNRSNKRQPLLSNGYQTSGNLFDLKNNFTDQIQNAIRLEIQKYRSNFESSGDVFIKNWPVEYGLYGWLIIMKSGGELSPHIHENGWLSGSIYINIPSNSKNDSGKLVVALGKDSDATDSRLNSKKVLDVVTGSMALFPASLMHHTIPFESEEERIVLAFDVIPKSH
jgi:tetratricopeptide (TPR) repeat protein